MKTLTALFLVSTLAISLASLQPEPLSNSEFDLSETLGVWFVVYAAPNPLNVSASNSIYCWEESFYIQNNYTTFEAYQSLNILGKVINTNNQGQYNTVNNSIWTFADETYAWIDLDQVAQNYGVIASLNASFFAVVSRIPSLDNATLQNEINIAVSQGYSNTNPIIPENSECPF